MFRNLFQETIFLMHIGKEIFHSIEMKTQRDIDLLDIALTLATEKGSFETCGIATKNTIGIKYHDKSDEILPCTT